MKCKKCGGSSWVLKPETFENGTEHIRRTCGNCGAFNGWAAADERTFREKLYFLVRDLAERPGTPDAYVIRARELIAKASPGNVR